MAVNETPGKHTSYEAIAKHTCCSPKSKYISLMNILDRYKSNLQVDSSWFNASETIRECSFHYSINEKRSTCPCSLCAFLQLMPCHYLCQIKLNVCDKNKIHLASDSETSISSFLLRARDCVYTANKGRSDVGNISRYRNIYVFSRTY